MTFSDSLASFVTIFPHCTGVSQKKLLDMIASYRHSDNVSRLGTALFLNVYSEMSSTTDLFLNVL